MLVLLSSFSIISTSSDPDDDPVIVLQIQRELSVGFIGAGILIAWDTGSATRLELVEGSFSISVLLRIR